MKLKRFFEFDSLSNESYESDNSFEQVEERETIDFDDIIFKLNSSFWNYCDNLLIVPINAKSFLSELEFILNN